VQSSYHDELLNQFKKHFIIKLSIAVPILVTVVLFILSLHAIVAIGTYSIFDLIRLWFNELFKHIDYIFCFFIRSNPKYKLIIYLTHHPITLLQNAPDHYDRCDSETLFDPVISIRTVNIFYHFVFLKCHLFF